MTVDGMLKDIMKKIYWQISQRKMTVFSMILIPDFREREHIFENKSLHTG